MMISIPVFNGGPVVSEVIDAVREFGLVVLDTTRPDAADIFAKVKSGFGLDSGQEHDEVLVHLAAQVDDEDGRSWIDYIFYSPTFDGNPLRVKALVARAHAQFVAARWPDSFIARVHKSV
ncbi:hypothetical protein [Xanthomonas arboricola]|uniref:hypothetical protein n=1 Tax=Xanthomonas arboricola TaxID=56448 RepID=UPI000CEF2A55|nr:hypothetical protein [Xanthomonas arboricola]PPU19303.1 hypothetical protein XarbCFBP7610_11590 [Xanthomonas arboricola]